MARFVVYGLGMPKTITAERMNIQMTDGIAIAVFVNAGVLGLSAAGKLTDTGHVVEEKEASGEGQH